MKLNELFGIKEEVERRLQQAQEKKEFKDAGERVAGSAKEKRALNAIKLEDLANIEKDEATAVELIVKDRIWPKLNPENELNNGVSSGCAYLKYVIRSAYAAKPKLQTHQSRREYIGLAERLQQILSGCFSVSDINRATAKLKHSRPSDFPFLYTEEELSNHTDEQLNNKYSSYYLYAITMHRMMATECYNILFRASEAGTKHWKKAVHYDGVTKEMEAAFLEKHQKDFQEQIEDIQAKIIEVTTANPSQLKEMKTRWRNVPNQLEEFRAKLLQLFEARVQDAEKGLKFFSEELKAREPDWSWSEKSTVKREKPDTELIINQPPPLEYIKRTGGIEITQVNETEIIEQFGFKYVEFGNSIPDKLAREHIRHFLGAMVDLFETLNINHKQINQIGELSIAFASRGKKGSVAHYSPLRRIININRRNGDGSVAHEWMHFLDHLIWLKFGKNTEKHQYVLASTRLHELTDTPTSQALSNLMNSLQKGDGTPKMIVQSYRASKEKNYSHKMKATYEETMDYLKLTYPYLFTDKYEKSNRDAKRVFGYTAYHFNKERIQVSRSLTRTSLFYARSSQMRSSYWIQPEELLARAFETIIADKLDVVGRANNYLVSDGLFDHPMGIYPQKVERGFFKNKFELLFEALKQDLGLTDFNYFSDRRVDEYIVFDQADNEKEEDIKAGVVVASDFSELLRLEIELYKAA
jgi:hypothetical protein